MLPERPLHQRIASALIFYHFVNVEQRGHQMFQDDPFVHCDESTRPVHVSDKTKHRQFHHLDNLRVLLSIDQINFVV